MTPSIGVGGERDLEHRCDLAIGSEHKPLGVLLGGEGMEEELGEGGA